MRVDLRQSRDTRPDEQPLLSKLVVGLHLIEQRRSRADQRHVAGDHMQELRELIDLEPAKPPTHKRDFGVIKRHQLLGVRCSIAAHGSKLNQAERLTVQAAANLRKKNRSTTGQFDQERGQDQSGQ